MQKKKQKCNSDIKIKRRKRKKKGVQFYNTLVFTVFCFCFVLKNDLSLYKAEQGSL